MPRGRIVRDVPIVLGVADGHRRRRLDDIDNRGRQCTQAHHPAARCPRGLVRVVRGSRRSTGDGLHVIIIAVRLDKVRIDAGMFVRTAVFVDVLHWDTGLMHMHDAQAVVFVGKAWRRPRPVGKRKGNARRQHAKHIDQGEQTACPQSLRSAQSNEHPALNLANQNTPCWKLTRKHSLRQARTHLTQKGSIVRASSVRPANHRHQFRDLLALVRFVAARDRVFHAVGDVVL